jgi:hypothetical protein
LFAFAALRMAMTANATMTMMAIIMIEDSLVRD